MDNVLSSSRGDAAGGGKLNQRVADEEEAEAEVKKKINGYDLAGCKQR